MGRSCAGLMPSPRSPPRAASNFVSANRRKISPRTGVPYSDALRPEFARSSSAASHSRFSSSERSGCIARGLGSTHSARAYSDGRNRPTPLVAVWFMSSADRSLTVGCQELNRRLGSHRSSRLMFRSRSAVRQTLRAAAHAPVKPRGPSARADRADPSHAQQSKLAAADCRT